MNISLDRSIDSFFGSRHQPYYICAPDYRQSSAGTRCLHYLCHSLNEMGLEAYISPALTTSPYLRTPRLTKDIVRGHFISGRRPIAVYPDTVSGNPLSAPTVARWLLNRPGHLGGDTHFPADDLLFYFDPWTLPEGMSGDMLRMPTVDTRLFNNIDNEFEGRRSGFCYYANKYLSFGGEISQHFIQNGTSLCHDIPRSHEQIAAILRQSETLYCYEPSAIVQEALACGCAVVIVSSDYWEKSKWAARAFGARLDSDTANLELVKAEVSAYRQHIEEEQQRAWAQLDIFVHRTQTATPHPALGTPPDGSAARPLDLWFTKAKDRVSKLNSLDHLYPKEFASPAAGAISIPGKALEDDIHPWDIALFNQRASAAAARASFEFVVFGARRSIELISSTLDSIGEQRGFEHTITVIADHQAPATLDKTRVRWIQSVANHAPDTLAILRSSNADWCCFLNAGDRLAPLAISRIVAWLDQHGDHSALCTDEASIDGEGSISARHFKCAAKHRLADGSMAVGMLLAKREAWLAAGGWRTLPRGLDEQDAALRLSDVCGETHFGHIPGILFLRHADNSPLEPNAHGVGELRRQIVKEHLLRSNDAARVEQGKLPHLCNIVPPLPAQPKISIIVLTKDNCAGITACVRSLLDETDYPALEILIIDNGTTEASARAYLDGLVASAPAGLQVASFDQPFNHATMCNAAAQITTGELLLFMHDDVEALHADWLKILAAQCLRPGVAMAGGRLLTADGNIQEAGIVPMQLGIAGNAFAGLAQDTTDPTGLLHTAHPVSAISAACMLVRRDVFEAVDGMDALNFPGRVADIDFCLKVRAAGHMIMWTPYATLQHDSDGSTQGNRHDNDALLAKWGSLLTDDPYFNPYLALGSKQFAPETEAALQADPITWHPLPNIFAARINNNWTAKGRLEQTILGATEQGRIRGRVGDSFPAPVQLKRLDIDTVYCAAPLTRQQLREVSRYRQLTGARIVMDIDQLLLFEFNVADPLRHIRSYLHHFDTYVDQFTCSSDWLVDQLPKWRERIQVVPETLAAKRWNSAPRKPVRHGEKMRIGWHVTAADRQVIGPVISALANQADWILLGEVPTELLPYAKERHQSVAYDDFPAKLAELDLDLAVLPLAVTIKNQCRSHLPILEYGYLGIPVIASDLAGHRTGLPITLVENTEQDWREAISKHLSDRPASRHQGEVLKQHVVANWMLEQHIDGWLRAWTKD